AELNATMRATVEKAVDGAVLAAHHQHRLFADPGALPVAGIRNFTFEREIAPGRSVEDALELAPVDVLVGVDPVGNARIAFRRPGARVQCFLRSAKRVCSTSA